MFRGQLPVGPRDSTWTTHVPFLCLPCYPILVSLSLGSVRISKGRLGSIYPSLPPTFSLITPCVGSFFFQPFDSSCSRFTFSIFFYLQNTQYTRLQLVQFSILTFLAAFKKIPPPFNSIQFSLFHPKAPRVQVLQLQSKSTKMHSVIKLSVAFVLVASTHASKLLTAIPREDVNRLFTRQSQAFEPGSSSGFGDTCVDAFGAGYLACGTGNHCYNPDGMFVHSGKHI